MEDRRSVTIESEQESQEKTIANTVDCVKVFRNRRNSLEQCLMSINIGRDNSIFNNWLSSACCNVEEKEFPLIFENNFKIDYKHDHSYVEYGAVDLCLVKRQQDSSLSSKTHDEVMEDFIDDFLHCL